MKYPLLCCCLWMLFSCNNTPVKPSSSDPIVVKDSALLKKEAANPYVPVDVSSMDMSYHPADYPIQKMNGQATAVPLARVVYSRPHRGGRKLFGNLVTWGQPWRLGANEATEIEFFGPVTIQKKRIEKGRYVLYAVPYPDHWTIILNSNLYSWGLKFNPANDVGGFEIPSVVKPQTVEYFTMMFDKTTTGADLLMAWEDREVRLPIQF